MTLQTADICDEHSDHLEVAEPIFRHWGRKRAFHGVARTVKVHEDNVLVKQCLSEPGEGRVLVVDGGGSLRRALMGDILAGMAIENGWAGVIINGCIRDSAVIDGMDIGVRALAANPLKSNKRGDGHIDVSVAFAGVTIRPGDHIYVDDDGILVAEKDLGS